LVARPAHAPSRHRLYALLACLVTVTAIGMTTWYATMLVAATLVRHP
jgi:hypothetical protein